MIDSAYVSGSTQSGSVQRTIDASGQSPAAKIAIRYSPSPRFLLMDSLDQIWESSRHNTWSAAYPTTILVGVIALIIISFIKQRLTRYVLAMVLVPICTLVAGEMSGREISEKWRIRQQWTIEHADQLTEKQQQLASGDGGNLVFGPLVATIQAFFICLGVASASIVFSEVLQKKRLEERS